MVPPRDTGEDFQTYNADPGFLQHNGMTVFGLHQGPMSYRAPVQPSRVPAKPEDVKVVRARECQSGIFLALPSTGSFGVKFGDGGYQAALSAIQKRHKNVKEIYDVIIDYDVMSVLGIFSQLCLKVTAKAI